MCQVFVFILTTQTINPYSTSSWLLISFWAEDKLLWDLTSSTFLQWHVFVLFIHKNKIKIKHCHHTSMTLLFLQNWIFILCPLVDVAAQNTVIMSVCIQNSTHNRHKQLYVISVESKYDLYRKIIHKKLQTIYLVLYKRQIKNSKNQKYKHERIR